MCCKQGQECEVTVVGTGTIDTTEYFFEAIFRDVVDLASEDIVLSFVIANFLDPNGPAPVDEESIVALGCKEL